jgi:hypothetical protein
MIKTFTEYKNLLEQLQELNITKPFLCTGFKKQLEIVSRKDCTFQQFKKAIDDVQELANNNDDVQFPQGIWLGELNRATAADLAPSKRVHATLQYCNEYLGHLVKDLENDDPLTNDKYDIIRTCINSLEADQEAATQLDNFNAIFNHPQNRETLNTRRDSAAITFLKGVLTVLSLGIAWAAGLWNTTGGNMSKNIDELDNFKATEAPQL